MAKSIALLVVCLIAASYGGILPPLPSIATDLNLTTLVSLLTAADLDLSTGTYTVFGPTNEAFATFAAANPTLYASLQSDVELLTSVLLYHAIGGSPISSGSITGTNSLESANEVDFLRITKYTGGGNTLVTVNQATVTSADNNAANGVIHVINSVLVPPSTDIFGIVVASATHTTLEQAVNTAGITLPAGEPFTLFAPTDAAFAALPAGLLANVLANGDILVDILGYHVISGAVFSPAAVFLAPANVSTLNGQDISLSVNSGVFVNAAQVTTADLVATNGVVHVINQVLIPAFNLDQVLRLNGYSYLSLTLAVVGLNDTIINIPSATVFAPSNDAFAAVAEFLANMTIEQAAQVILYHVIPSTVLSSALSDDLVAATVNGASLRFNIYELPSGDVATVNGVPIEVVDLTASNGVVHGIDQVLLPPAGNLSSVLASTPELSTLLSLAGAADLLSQLDALNLPGLTIFAPTNAAFAAVPAATLEALQNDATLLFGVLAYHALGRTVFSTGLYDGQSLSTLNGASLEVNIAGGAVQVGGATVTSANILVNEGTVHLINAVLLPPGSTTGAATGATSTGAPSSDSFASTLSVSIVAFLFGLLVSLY